MPGISTAPGTSSVFCRDALMSRGSRRRRGTSEAATTAPAAPARIPARNDHVRLGDGPSVITADILARPPGLSKRLEPGVGALPQDDRVAGDGREGEAQVEVAPGVALDRGEGADWLAGARAEGHRVRDRGL